MPLFSVVITAFNKGDFIKGTIESVLKQTIQDFEIIIIDDGSADNTKEQILQFKDKRLKYHFQKPSGLPAYARNRGIERANGRYIALLDGDDIWSPEKLKKVQVVFLEHPEIDIVCHDIKLTGENIRSVRRTYVGPYPKDIYSKLLWEGNCLGVTMAVLKREIFFTHRFWFDEDERLFAVEDYEFWLRLAESEKFNFHYLPEVLAEHIVSEKGIVLSNIERSAVNGLYLFDRYIKKHKYDIDSERKKVIRKRRASMMKSAGLSYNYNKAFTQSLRWFLKATKEYPFDKNNYVGLLSSVFRIRLGRI